MHPPPCTAGSRPEELCLTTGTAHADWLIVTVSRLQADPVLDALLAELPPAVGVGHRGGQRFVASLAGIFVLDPALDGIDLALPGAERLAGATRDELAEHLSWVPFVDWFIVTDEPGVAGPTLPHAQVNAAILDGHSIDEATLRRVKALLEVGDLEPRWTAGLPPSSDSLRESLLRLRPNS